MENKWQLILHEKCEDPYYEITNGPISLIANCGLVGEDDADEDNIFNRVKDQLNISGIIFHSGNALEIKQHLEIQELKYKADKLEVKNERLKEHCEKMADVLKTIVNAPVPGNAFQYMAWFVTAKNIAGGAISEWEAEQYVDELKEGESNTPAPVQGEKEADNG